MLLAGVDGRSADAIVGRMLVNVQSLDIPHPENRPWQVVTASAGSALPIRGDLGRLLRSPPPTRRSTGPSALAATARSARIA